MVSAKDWRVPGQVIEVVHDDSHEQVEHKEGAKEDEGDEVGVGHVGATSLQRVKEGHHHILLKLYSHN